MKTLALFHTVHGVIPVFEQLCARIMPGVRTCHLLDESPLRDLIRRGRLDAEITRRVCDYVVRAEAGGADVVLVTCSSISPCVDAARPLVSVPVLKVDEPMARRAVARGGTIGVAATLPTTLEPTAQLVRQCARRRRVRVVELLCPGAFQALQSGHVEEHDQRVAAGIAALARRCRTVVLAQASMSRAADGVVLPKNVRVLTSPRLGVQHAARVIRRMA